MGVYHQPPSHFEKVVEDINKGRELQDATNTITGAIADALKYLSKDDEEDSDGNEETE